MIRSRWIAGLAGVLAFLAPASAEPFFKSNQVITVQEGTGPARKCKVLRTWAERDGSRLCEAQALDTGEKLTILEPKADGATKAPVRILRTAKAPTASPYAGMAPGAEPPVVASESFGQVERWGEADTKKAEAESARRVESAARATPPLARQGTPEPVLAPEKFTKVPLPSSAAPTPPPIQTVSKADVPPPPGPLAPPMARLPGDPAPKPSMWSRLTGVGLTGGGLARPAPRVETPAPEPRAPFGHASVSAAHALMVEEQQAAGKGRPTKVESTQGAFPMPPAVSLPGRPTWTDSGVPAGMSNAFTTGVTSRPVPADFGIGFGGPGAFEPRPAGVLPPPPPPPAEILKGAPPDVQAIMHAQHQAMLAQYNAAMRGQAPAAPRPVQPHPVEHEHATVVVMAPPSPAVGLIATLQKSPLPSEREMAADQLKRMDWKSDGGVVAALARSAQTDPAPMVRVSCVRALGYMKANTPEAIQTLEALTADQDARVRSEAAETLSSMKRKR